VHEKDIALQNEESNLDISLVLRNRPALTYYQQSLVFRELADQTRKVNSEVCKLIRYIEPSVTESERLHLERESVLVRRVKPTLTQRSIELAKMSSIDLSIFT
jgi:hypothetical protein